MLILCGSYIGMMEETVLGYRAPLYGRRTAQYLLEPLEFFDAQFFFKKYKSDDRLRTMLFMEVRRPTCKPFGPGKTLETNILNSILERGSLLYDEFDFYCSRSCESQGIIMLSCKLSLPAIPVRMRSSKAAGLESITAYLETLQQFAIS